MELVIQQSKSQERRSSYREFFTSYPYPGAEQLGASRVRRTQTLSLKYGPERQALSDVTITEVTWENMVSAVQFVREQFAYDGTVDPAQYLVASLTPEDPDTLAFLARVGLTNNLKYWVITSETGDVLGICGLYEYDGDDPSTVWGGWSAVEECVRNRGLFKTMARHLLTLAKKRGKKWIKLYTSEDEHETSAQQAYDNMGVPKLSPDDEGYPADEIVATIQESYREEGAPKIVFRGIRIDT